MELEDSKLYVRISCSICRGKNIGCVYCDAEGKHYVEASTKRVNEWLKNQREEDKVKFRNTLEEI